MERVVSAISRAPARRCSSGASSVSNFPRTRRGVRMVGVALTARLESMPLGLFDASHQLARRFSQRDQLPVASADGAGAQLPPESPVHLGGPPDPEQLLERLRVASARRTQ